MMLHLRATYFSDKYRKTVAAIRRKKHCNCSVAARAAMPRKTEDNAANTAAPTKPKRQGRNKTQAAMPRTQRQCRNKTKAAMPRTKKEQGGNAASTCACSIVVRYSITATEYMFLFICVSCRRCKCHPHANAKLSQASLHQLAKAPSSPSTCTCSFPRAGGLVRSTITRACLSLPRPRRAPGASSLIPKAFFPVQER